MNEKIKEAIRTRAHDFGFDKVGFTQAEAGKFADDGTGHRQDCGDFHARENIGQRARQLDFCK